MHIPYMNKKSSKMTPSDVQRIQSSSDSTNRNQDFKARAQSAVAKRGKK